jgi:cellulose synthase (UDP-forming)
VLFLVCMMSVQAPAHRSEERFAFDEPVGIFAANGALSTGRIRDISLSGAAIVVDADADVVTQVGEFARVFIREVGFVPGRVVRQTDRFLALHFDLPQSIERELLISKLFTLGLNTAHETSSAAAATIAILRSIVAVRSDSAPIESHATPAVPTEKLAAESLVVRPSARARRLPDVGAERRSFGA